MSFYSCCLVLCFHVFLWSGKGSRDSLVESEIETEIPWLNLSHSVIVISWLSEKSYKVDSGNKGRNGLTSKMFQLLASPLKYEYYLSEFKKIIECTMLCNYIQLSHVTCSSRTKKSDLWKIEEILIFFPQW